MEDAVVASQLVTPQWLAVLCLASLLILFGPRKWILPLLMVVTGLFSVRNRMDLGGMNFPTVRFLLLVSWVRILMKGEHRGLERVPLDKAWILFCCWCVITETLQRGFPGTVYAGATRLYDGLGTYFLVRILLRGADLSTLTRLMPAFAVVCCILGTFMFLEQVTGRTLLTLLGADSAAVQVREGKIRSVATFQHPVLAGTYGVVLLPLFAACWWQQRMRPIAVVGSVGATVMALTANSGGPIMTYASVILAVCLWPLRRNLRPIRWGVLITLVFLQLVMNGPVWSLIAHLHVIEGASAYHRYEIVDAFMRHLGDWWLIGTEETESWGAETWDVANTYLVVAKHGGLLGLILFIRVIVACCREIGWRRSEVEFDRPTEILVWALGASFCAHLVSFFGTSYFDQTNVLWHFTLALIASLTFLIKEQNKILDPVAEEGAESENDVHLGTALPAS